MSALAIDDKGNVYAEVDAAKGDYTAIPAGYSLIESFLLDKMQIVAKTVDTKATILAYALTDARADVAAEPKAK